jgi:hypothetical protein
MASGKFVVKIYSRRTLRAKRFVGPFRTRASALKYAKNYSDNGAYKRHPSERVGILGP